MIDRKVLELAFNKDVPAEAKAAAKTHLSNLQAIDKADQKMKAARDERAKAAAAADESDRALSEILAKWVPADVASAAK